MRDKAMLELLYATGMRVSELVHLEVEDVNLRFGWIICRENGKERMIPFGGTAGKALQMYLDKGRNTFLKNEEDHLLFFNCSGAPMSRQGFWKVLKGYASRAGIEKVLHRGCFVIPVRPIWQQAEPDFRLFGKCWDIRIWLPHRFMRNFSRELQLSTEKLIREAENGKKYCKGAEAY